jgi:hypothetical protein
VLSLSQRGTKEEEPRGGLDGEVWSSADLSHHAYGGGLAKLDHRWRFSQERIRGIRYSLRGVHRALHRGGAARDNICVEQIGRVGGDGWGLVLRKGWPRALAVTQERIW